MSDLEVRKREITALAGSVTRLEYDLALGGANAIDEFDRMEALDIINRIERRILASPPHPPQREAAVHG